MITILVIEDDPMVRLLIRTQLGSSYLIKEAANGMEALELLDHESVDLMIVDIQMPVMNGFEFVRTLREGNDNTPIIMLTAYNTFAFRKEGFSSGIDDFITKPIDYDELTWRIEAILRRARIVNEKCIQIGNFSMLHNSYSATYNGKNIALTKTEFTLLYKLLSYPNVVFTKEQLMDEVWGYDTDSDNSVIKTYINRLRNKFAECNEFELVSIRGLGYKAVIHKGDS